MQYLTHKILFCQGEIACHFLRTPLPNEPLILLIPGGPCLSGLYLDTFLFTLARYTKMNIGLLDLPNHGDSILPGDQLPLSYQSCLDAISSMLSEVEKHTNKLLLFGQSFGARLAFDLLAYSNTKIHGAFLTGFPYKFELSEALLAKLNSLEMPTVLENSPENSFKERWKKILPLYTHSSLPQDIFDVLASNTKLLGNEYLLDNVPPIEICVSALHRKKMSIPIAILQGTDDGVVPDNNLQILRSLIPHAQYFEVDNCGHFPMIEHSEKTLLAFLEFTVSLEK